MGILRHAKSKCSQSLGHRCLVGRTTVAHLSIREREVSAEHASIYYRSGWKVRDLASSNGTFLNGKKLASKVAIPLEKGDVICFGELRNSWALVDDSPPGPTALTADGTRVSGTNACLWLPAEEPQLAVFAQNGEWVAESNGEPFVVEHGGQLSVSGQTWTLELPPADEEVLHSTRRLGEEAAALEFRFEVSADQEHVHINVRYGGSEFDLGARVHNYALLVLASRRLRDPDEGWFYADELSTHLSMDRQSVNLQLWRARKAFKMAGIPPELVVERRPDTKQLRFGSDAIVVNGSSAPESTRKLVPSIPVVIGDDRSSAS